MRIISCSLEKRREQNIRSHGNMNENLKKQSVKYDRKKLIILDLCKKVMGSLCHSLSDKMDFRNHLKSSLENIKE